MKVVRFFIVRWNGKLHGYVRTSESRGVFPLAGMKIELEVRVEIPEESQDLTPLQEEARKKAKEQGREGEFTSYIEELAL